MSAERDSTKMAVKRFSIPKEARQAKMMKKTKAPGKTLPTGRMIPSTIKTYEDTRMRVQQLGVGFGNFSYRCP